MIAWDYDLDMGILCSTEELKKISLYCEKELPKYNKNYKCKYGSIADGLFSTKIEFWDPSKGEHLDEKQWGPYWYNVIIDIT
jgi:hypothetical protein